MSLAKNLKQNLFKTIFSKYNTDKVTHDFFHSAYDESFLSIRKDVRLLFEVGVWKGGSLMAFRDYFPNAQIVGFEINPKRKDLDLGERIIIEIGDATDKAFIDSMLTKYGQPDIIVDDGSHKSSDIKRTFELLFEHASFCYVIEDLVTQYTTFQRGKYINDGIPATTIVHELVDNLLANEVARCRAIRLNYAICFFFK